jgi:hypothetical protein
MGTDAAANSDVKGHSRGNGGGLGSFCPKLS